MASTALEYQDRAMSIGRVISRGFAVIGGNPLATFGMAFVLGALPSLAMNYAGQYMRDEILTAGRAAGVVGFYVLTALVSVALTMLVQGALVQATIAHTEGRRASFGECLAAGGRVLLPLFGMSLLIGIATALGFALLIVPGIMVYIIWSVASPALVAEGGTVSGALKRSQYLTRGARWRVFGLELIIVVFYWLVSGALTAILLASYGFGGIARAGQGLPWGWYVSSLVVSTLVTTIWATMQTSLYVELRDWKDGPAAGNLAEIFA